MGSMARDPRAARVQAHSLRVIPGVCAYASMKKDRWLRKHFVFAVKPSHWSLAKKMEEKDNHRDTESTE